VVVSFEVDNFVEVADSVPLHIVNPPRNAWPVIGRKELACVIAIPESSQDTFLPDSLKAVVDLKNITKGEYKIFPTVVGLPPYSRVIELDSISIKF
jgi:hypothetical protein